MKRTFLLFLIILFYMAKVAYSQEIKPGVVITKDNLKKYLPELKEILPLGPLEHFKDGVKEGQITIPIVKKRIYSPPPGYARATAKNEGGLRVAKDNTLTGHWHGGLPFPRPETGQELAWNVYRRRECMEEFQLKVNYLLFDKNHQLERSFKNYFFKKCYVGRTDILPSPEISGNNGLLNWKEVFLVVEPLDVKGFSMIRIHYEDL
ncbi:MAG: DUF1329 domain-containing protein, partial [Thermodesulfobacteriota bacterium]|nr:DUF1329 domain-containing protein [Thermodesulfobacteriota bacterium]